MIALFVGAPACGTHVLVGEEDTAKSKVRPDEDAGPRDAGSPGLGPSDAGGDGGVIHCGTSVCGPRDLGGGLGVGGPCCFGATRCGAQFSSACVELDSPGTVDTTCASLAAYPGCCRPDGTCGIVATGTALGCVNPFALLPITPLGTCQYPKP